LPGSPRPRALEEILDACHSICIFLGPHGMGRWQQREKDLALDRQTRDPAFPVIPDLLPDADPALGFLSLNTWVDLRGGLDNPLALEILSGAVQGHPPGPDLLQRVSATLASVCPYRGLRFFREEDTPFFFGQDAFVERLAGAVERRALVGVVGASGSGKSSVVLAGLVPHLRRGACGSVWDAIAMVPGDRPLRNLAGALLPLLEPELTETDQLAERRKLAEFLASEPDALRDVVGRILQKQPGTDRLLLVVDQWEELYTLARHEQEQRRFQEALLDAAAFAPLTVVLTLRGDFYGRALAYRPLSDRLQDAVVNLGPMTEPELQQAIEAPARKVGLTFEPGLVTRLLRDVKEQPGSLPLLEFVLTELWQQRQGGQLSHEAYERIGGLQGAIARRAEEVFTALTVAEQQTARRVFLQLVHVGEGTETTRRRAACAALGEGSQEVVRRLADARLVVTGRALDSGEDTVEVAHESLLHAWPRLREWIESDRGFRAWQARFRVALREWEISYRDSSTVLRGIALVEAKDWGRERPTDLTDTEKEFIRKSTRPNTWRRMGAWVMAVSGPVVALYTVPLGILRLSQGWASRGEGWEYLLMGVGCGFIAAISAISFWWTGDRRYRLYQLRRGAADKPPASGTLRSRVDFYLRRAGIDFYALPKSQRRKWITLIVAAFSLLVSFCAGLVGLVWLFFSDMQVVRLNRALLDAINRGDTTIVRELLDKGADSGATGVLDRPYSFLATALPLAARQGYLDLVQLLLDRGADGRGQALFQAAANDRVDVMKLLLKRGVEADTQETSTGRPPGYTPLMGAAMNGRLESMQLLLDDGATINKRGPDGVTALALAASSGRRKVVEFLLDRGADLNVRDFEGKTPLGRAKENNRDDIVLLLKKAGAKE
jgi:energy-coupling factor transporter ATP-binding protein EcfA2